MSSTPSASPPGFSLRFHTSPSFPPTPLRRHFFLLSGGFAILDSPPLNPRLWGTWWREWTSTSSTLKTVSRNRSVRPAPGAGTRSLDGRACSSHNDPILILFSAEQEQQAGAHHPAQPARAPDRRRRGVHRLHSPHAVRGQHGTSPFQPVGGDPGVAPPRGQVAQRSLPLLRSPSCTTPVIRSVPRWRRRRVVFAHS